MIFGEVPYQSKTIDDLLYDINNVGVAISPEVKISQNLVQLIHSLLEPNPAARITHEDLFNIVLEDKNFLEKFLEKGAEIIKTAQDNNNNPNINPEVSVLDEFLAEVVKDRHMYTFLVSLAKKTLKHKT